MDDHKRSEKPLLAVHVCSSDLGDEYHKVGSSDVTAIGWGWTSGSMAALLMVQVFKNGQLHSEHPFINVQSVYYDLDFEEVKP